MDGSGSDEDRKIKRVNSTGNDLGLYVLFCPDIYRVDNMLIIDTITTNIIRTLPTYPLSPSKQVMECPKSPIFQQAISHGIKVKLDPTTQVQLLLSCHS